jgi:hypothetical protein
MESTDIEPDPRLAKLCLYCSRVVSKLDGPLKQIQQGNIFIKVENPPDFRTWVAAAENGCGMCSAFLDGLRAYRGGGEAISTSSPEFEKLISEKVTWTMSALRLKHPNDFSRDPDSLNKIILLDREITTNDGRFFSQTLITKRESSKHQ